MAGDRQGDPGAAGRELDTEVGVKVSFVGGRQGHSFLSEEGVTRGRALTVSDLSVRTEAGRAKQAAGGGGLQSPGRGPISVGAVRWAAGALRTGAPSSPA